MIKCEMINKVISIPQCILNNFTSKDDYCRFIVYDNEQEIEEPKWSRKIYAEAYGFKKLGYFNYFRDSSLDSIEILDHFDSQIIKDLFKEHDFEDYTPDEKERIKINYANHPINTSLFHL